MRLLYFIVVLGLLSGKAPAQPVVDRQDGGADVPLPAAPRLRFQHLTNEDGLTQNLVWSMLQDRRGFMWFGMEDGLNRYDGYTFTVYEAVPFDSTSLLDDNVYALAEGPDGELWAGTTSGLSRLDPHTGRFRHYRHDEGDPASIPPGSVDALVVEPSGAVWVGMTSSGLSRLDPRMGRFRHYRHDPRDATSLSSDRVRALHHDADGALWVGTTNGLNRLAPGGTFRRYLYSPAGLWPDEAQFRDSSPPTVRASFIVSLCDDPTDRDVRWVWTGAGLVRLDARTGQTRLFAPPPLPRGSQGDNGAVGNAVLPDPRAPGVLWVASRQGLYHFDVRTGHFTPYRHDPDRPSSIAGEHLRGLLVDRTGLVWVQTNVEGVERFDPAGTAFFHGRFVPEGVPATGSAASVGALTEDGAGRLWFTAADLIRLDRTTGTYTPLREAPPLRADDRVLRVYADRAGALWLGWVSGVVDRIIPLESGEEGDIARRVLRLAPGERQPLALVLLFYEDREGVLWAGGGRGLSRWDPHAEAFRRVPLAGPSGREEDEPLVFALLKDADGLLWVGTRTGLLRLDRATGPVTAYRHDPRDPTSLSTDVVYALHERPREPGILWVGTTSGLDRFDTRTGQATHFGRREGLPNATIYAILEDEGGHLWMSTNDGLVDFDPETRTISHYGTDVGVQSREFNGGAAYRSPRTGELFFGGINGFNAFFPARVAARNPHPPAVVLTGLRIANHPVAVSADGPLRVPIEEAAEVRLGPSERSVTFEYVGLHFQDPARNRYAYRLDGFDRGWVDAGTERTATYTNLDPGTYTFRVKAASSNRVWNEEGASIRLVVLPAWWQTAWARLAGVLALAGLAFAVHRVREGRRRVAEALRLRIATDLHDEVGSGLTQVTLYSELIRRAAEGVGGDGSPQEDGARVAAWAARVGEQATTLSGAMRDVVWAIRPDEDDWESLELRMKDAAVALLAPRGIALDMHGAADGTPPALSPEVRQNVLLFFKEAVHNAVRHGDPTQVTVRWHLSRRALALRIADDGRGFDPTSARRGTGLLSLHRRAEALGGTFALASAPGEGTRLALDVPLGWGWLRRRRVSPSGADPSKLTGARMG